MAHGLKTAGLGYPQAIYSLLICRYNRTMMSQVTGTSMANCDAIIIAYRKIDSTSLGLSWHVLY